MTKKKEDTPRKRGKYDKKTVVKGSFTDIIKASVKDAEKKSAKKKG